VILIGRLLSPFVRRTQVSLNVLGLESQRKALSTATDMQAIGELNPLRRVPALILDDGEVLIDSIAILDYLDELVGPKRALLPATGPERRNALKLLSLAVGAAEKTVVAHYEKSRRPEDKFWDQWFDAATGQALAGLGALEAAAPEDGGWLAGAEMSQVDISTAVTYEFINIVLPDLIDEAKFPRLAALARRMNTIEGYSSTHPSQD
jgi:glutathione S-transferase